MISFVEFKNIFEDYYTEHRDNNALDTIKRFNGIEWKCSPMSTPIVRRMLNNGTCVLFKLKFGEYVYEFGINEDTNNPVASDGRLYVGSSFATQRAFSWRCTYIGFGAGGGGITFYEKCTNIETGVVTHEYEWTNGLETRSDGYQFRDFDRTFGDITGLSGSFSDNSITLEIINSGLYCAYGDYNPTYITLVNTTLAPIYNWLQAVGNQEGKDYLQYCLVEGAIEDSEDSDKTPYYKNKKYYAHNVVKMRDSGTSYSGYPKDFYINMDNGYLCGKYVNGDNEGQTDNIRLFTVSDGSISYDNGETWEDITASEISAITLTRQANYRDYKVSLDTNIPLFKNTSDCLDYVLTGDVDKAENLEDVNTTKDKEEEVTRTTSPDYNIGSGFVLSYDTSYIITDLARWLIDDKQQISDGALFWGNNPSDAFIENYWTPIDMVSLGMVESSKPVTLCGIQAEDSSGNALNASVFNLMSVEHEIGSYRIVGTYGDWRDYTLFKYQLYLPFYGTINIPTDLLMNRHLRVTMRYYTRGHKLKYYVYINNILFKCCDSSVGVDIPISSKNAVQKAQEQFSGYTNMIGGALSAVGGVGSLASGNIFGLASGITNGASNIASGVVQVFKNASSEVFGSCDATSNVNDYTEVFLIETEQVTYKPSNLNSVYGYPSYVIDTISAHKGYCELKDVRLDGVTILDDEEKEELKAMLSKGVIL